MRPCRPLTASRLRRLRRLTSIRAFPRWTPTSTAALGSRLSTTLTVRLPNNWTRRPYQQPLWSYLRGGGLRADVAWHRRAGKDDVSLHWTAIAAMKRVGTYW